MCSKGDSPVNSSSSDDFAAYLDTELESASVDSPEPEEDASETRHLDTHRTKRQKLETLESVTEGNDSSQRKSIKKSGVSAEEEDICTHPGSIGGMCIKCGVEVDDQSSVAFGYIYKDLRLADDEITRLRGRDLKDLFSRKKLCLVLDLDLTLLNSARIKDITPEEGYLMNEGDSMQDALRGNLFKMKSMRLMTKLRPFVHTFLKEASKDFEMYIYTKGERFYALEMANLLDPQKIYFDSRVIAHSDSTQRHQKSLDVVLGQESSVLILDDTEEVWVKHKANLILMERYHFFASSFKRYRRKYHSLSEMKSDENEADGALATILQVLKRIHKLFFHSEPDENFAGRDVRQVLKTVRGEILKGCKIVFTRVFRAKFPAEKHQLWKMAEQLGATCATEVDPSVTHVISINAATAISRWAVTHNKFLVAPRWLIAANYLWKKQPEDNFPVIEIIKNR